MALLHAAQLKVILDTDTVTPDDGDLESYLIGLLGLPDFLLLRYSDAGPPAAERKHDEHFRTDYAPGWLTIHPVDEPSWDMTAYAAYVDGDDRLTSTFVGGGDLLELPLHYALQQLQDPIDEQRDQLRRDLTLQIAGDDTHMPILVTNRAVLLNPIPGLPGLQHDCAALSPKAALVFVGFWLRAKGEYVIQAGNGTTGRTDRVLFYSLATQGLLPAGWRWSRAISQADRSNQRHLHQLTASQRSRVGTALKARDRCRTAEFSMSTSDARDEAIDCVVDVAMNLMGAFDATAQMVEILNPTKTPLHYAKWQDRNWPRKQRKHLPDLLDAAQRHRPIFDIIRILRNTIHARGLHTLLVKNATSVQPDESYLALPEEQTEDLRKAFEGSGGFDAWQVQELYRGHLQADPDRLIDEMIIRATAALNEMMDATPVGQLLNVTPEPSATPLNEGVASERYRTNVRRQIGL